MTTADPSEYLLKTTKDPVNIPKLIILQIRCQVKVLYVKQDSVLLEPHVNLQCLEALKPWNSKKGEKSPVVKISVQNITDHKIRLAGKTELGTMQSIKSVQKSVLQHHFVQQQPVSMRLQKTPVWLDVTVKNCGTHFLM